MEIRKFSLAGLIIRRGGETALRYSRVSLPCFLLLIRAQDVRAREMDGRNGEGEQWLQLFRWRCLMFGSTSREKWKTLSVGWLRSRMSFGVLLFQRLVESLSLCISNHNVDLLTDKYFLNCVPSTGGSASGSYSSAYYLKRLFPTTLIGSQIWSLSNNT